MIFYIDSKICRPHRNFSLAISQNECAYLNPEMAETIISGGRSVELAHMATKSLLKSKDESPRSRYDCIECVHNTPGTHFPIK